MRSASASSFLLPAIAVCFLRIANIVYFIIIYEKERRKEGGRMGDVLAELEEVLRNKPRKVNSFLGFLLFGQFSN